MMRKFIIAMFIYACINEVFSLFNFFWTSTFFIVLFTLTVLIVWLPIKFIKKVILN